MTGQASNHPVQELKSDHRETLHLNSSLLSMEDGRTSQGSVLFVQSALWESRFCVMSVSLFL